MDSRTENMAQTPAVSDPPQMPMTRKLVTVRRISSIKPIQGTQSDIVTVDGWNVIHPKGEYKPGDLVVYCEIDSFLPSSNERFWEYSISSGAQEFDGERGYVVHTTMRHGHVSQGLIFPVGNFPEIMRVKQQLANDSTEDGTHTALMEMDFTNLLGVKKFEEYFEDHTMSYGRPPLFFPQPGCDRAQNVVDLFGQYGATQFHITEKLDGVPMTIYRVARGSQWYKALPHGPNGVGRERPGYGVCGRSKDYVDRNDSLFWKVARDQSIIPKMWKVGSNIAVQGELCGHTIMNNSMGFKEGQHHFYAFGIYDIDKQRWMKPQTAVQICQSLKIHHAPVIGLAKLSDFAKDVYDLLKKAEGTGLLGKNREGLVFKTLDNSFSFKTIANSWLLKHGKDKISQW